MNRFLRNYGGILISIISVGIVLSSWKIGSICIGADIILPPPEIAALRLIKIISKAGFLRMVGSTLFRVFWSFSIAFVGGTIVGLAAGYSSVFRKIIRPSLTVIRTTPVLAVILLALIWFKTDSVPIFASVLMTFPVVCVTVVQGVAEIDQKLIEMGKVFDLTKKDIFLHISLPSIIPYLITAAHTTLGLAWKVVIAAEVLSLPDFGIGSGMQEAQLNLETADVLAWTTVAVVLSGFSDWGARRASELISWRSR